MSELNSTCKAFAAVNFPRTGHNAARPSSLIAVQQSRVWLAGVAWRDLRLARDRHSAPKSREEDHAYHETSGTS